MTFYRSAMIKLFVACMLLCCVYMLYMVMMKTASAAPLSYGLLIPGFIAAFLIQKTGQLTIKTFTGFHWYFCMTLGCIYACILLGLLVKEFPAVWMLEHAEQFPELPIVTFKAVFDELAVTATGALLWFLGWRLARMSASFSAVFFEFQMGFSLLLILLIMIQGFGIQVEGMLIITALFFILGLTCLVLSKETGSPAAGHKSMLPTKITYAVLCILLILAVTALFVLLINPEMINSLIHFFLSIVKWIWARMLELADWFFNLFPESEHATRKTAGTDASGSSESMGIDIIKNRQAREIGRIIMGLFWSGFILFALWRMSVSLFQFLKKLRTPSQDIKYETLPDGFKTDLHQWIKWLREKMHTLFFLLAQSAGTILPLHLLFPDTFAKAPVIQDIYAKLLKWSDKKGIKRNKAFTPAEHAKKVADRWPKTARPLKKIIRSYEQYYYGKNTLMQDEETEVSQAWRRLKQIKTPRLKRS